MDYLITEDITYFSRLCLKTVIRQWIGYRIGYKQKEHRTDDLWSGLFMPHIEAVVIIKYIATVGI